MIIETVKSKAYRRVQRAIKNLTPDETTELADVAEKMWMRNVEKKTKK